MTNPYKNWREDFMKFYRPTFPLTEKDWYESPSEVIDFIEYQLSSLAAELMEATDDGPSTQLLYPILYPAEIRAKQAEVIKKWGIK